MDAFFLVYFFSFPLLVILLMKGVGVPLLKVSIPAFVILAVFVFSYVGCFPLYFGWDEYRYETGVQNQLLVFEVLMISSWAIVSMVAGFGASSYVLGPCVGWGYCAAFRPLKKLEVSLTLLLGVLCCAVLFLYLVKVPVVALFVALKDGASEAMHARSFMGNDFVGKYHRYSFFMHDLMGLVAFTFFANWLVLSSRTAFFVFLAFFFLSAFATVMATEKAPFVWFLIGLLLVYCLVERKGNIPLVSLFKLGGGAVLTLMFFYIYFMGSSSPFLALKSIASSAFSGGVQGAYHYLEFFPAHQGFLMGQSLPNPGGIFPFEPYRLAVEVMAWRFPEFAQSGVVASSPTVYWGEAFANWGFVGVALVPFFVGMCMYVVNLIVLSLENNPLKVALLVWLMLHYKDLAVTGFSKFIFDFRLFVVFFVVFFIMSIPSFCKIKYYNL